MYKLGKVALLITGLIWWGVGLEVVSPSKTCTDMEVEKGNKRMLMGGEYLINGGLGTGMTQQSLTLRGNGNLRADQFQDELMMLEGTLVQNDDSVQTSLLTVAAIDYFEGEGWVLYALTYHYPFLSYTTYQILKQTKPERYTVLGSKTHSSSPNQSWWHSAEVSPGQSLSQHISQAINSISGLRDTQPTASTVLQLPLIGGEMYLLRMTLSQGYIMNMTLLHFRGGWHRLSTSVSTPVRQCNRPSFFKMTHAAIQQDQLLHAMYRYVYQHISSMLTGLSIGWVARAEFENKTIVYQVVYNRSTIAVQVLEMTFDPHSKTIVNVAFRNITQFDLQIGIAPAPQPEKSSQPVTQQERPSEQEPQTESEPQPQLSAEELQKRARKLLVTKHSTLAYKVEFEEVESKRHGKEEVFTFTMIDRRTSFWRVTIGVQSRSGAVREIRLQKCD